MTTTVVARVGSERRRTLPRPPAALRPYVVSAVGVGAPLALIACDAATPFVPAVVVLFLLEPILIEIWTLAVLRSTMECVGALRRRAWRRGAAFAALPLAFLFVLRMPAYADKTLDAVGDVVHLVVMRPTYDRVAESGDRPHVAIFMRSGFAGLPGDGIVYDATDEIARAPSRRSAAWKARIANTELACGADVTPMWAHYYRADFFC